MTKTTDNAALDWWAVTQSAQGLGVNTRRLVALHDTDGAREWALRMSREQSGVTSISYYELAVMLGHRDPNVAAGASLDWNELLIAANELAATVKSKAAAEKAAAEKAEAERIEAAEKAAAEAAARAAAEREAAEQEAAAVGEAVSDVA